MTAAEKIDYLSQATAAVDQVYAKVVELACIHQSGSKTYDQMVSNMTITCAASASIAYQEAGILASGKMVNHLDAVGGTDANILKRKSAIAKAMIGAGNVPADKADVVYVGKRYADLPAQYKQKGVLYVQDSNVCIYAGDGAIYSCNQAKDQVNDKGQHITGAIAAGVKRMGVYWWTTHITIAQAEADAGYLLKLLAPY